MKALLIFNFPSSKGKFSKHVSLELFVNLLNKIELGGESVFLYLMMAIISDYLCFGKVNFRRDFSCSYWGERRKRKIHKLLNKIFDMTQKLQLSPTKTP